VSPEGVVQPATAEERPASGMARPVQADKRIAAVDAARGCAMVLVCLSHIKHHFTVSAPELAWTLMVVTRVATPTFLLLSGFVISYLLKTDVSGKARITLIDRGLFLLLVAHLLVGLADLPNVGFLEWYLGRSLITDAVAVALFAAVLVRRRSGVALAVLGAALCLVSWILATTLDASTPGAKMLGAILFDLKSARSPMIDAPLVPYVGVFFLGMALNLHLLPFLERARNAQIAARLFIAGAAAILVVVAGVIAWHFAKDYIASWSANPAAIELVRSTLNPLTKRPPSPAYLLFYGGAALWILAMFFARRPAALIDRLVIHASVIGRASLMSFVVQDWLFHLAPRVFGYDEETSVAFWFAYFAVGIVVLYFLAKAWGRVHGNRYMTVGLRRAVPARQPANAGTPRARAHEAIVEVSTNEIEGQSLRMGQGAASNVSDSVCAQPRAALTATREPLSSCEPSRRRGTVEWAWELAAKQLRGYFPYRRRHS
jgi:uncharacterized membrane protein